MHRNTLVTISSSGWRKEPSDMDGYWKRTERKCSDCRQLTVACLRGMAGRLTELHPCKLECYGMVWVSFWFLDGAERSGAGREPHIVRGVMANFI